MCVCECIWCMSKSERNNICVHKLFLKYNMQIFCQSKTGNVKTKLFCQYFILNIESSVILIHKPVVGNNIVISIEFLEQSVKCRNSAC